MTIDSRMHTIRLKDIIKVGRGGLHIRSGVNKHMALSLPRFHVLLGLSSLEELLRVLKCYQNE